MKDIVVVDYVDKFGPIGKELDEDTKKSYLTMAERLKELGKRNMRLLKRKEKIKRICQN
jgi:Zn-dependent peptidase ImmA (M78 family)